jgi:hypothetical protein
MASAPAAVSEVSTSTATWGIMTCTPLITISTIIFRVNASSSTTSTCLGGKREWLHAVSR